MPRKAVVNVESGRSGEARRTVLPAPAPDTAAVTAKEIQDWFDAHRSELRAPERVTLEYVDIDGGALPPPAQALW